MVLIVDEIGVEELEEDGLEVVLTVDETGVDELEVGTELVEFFQSHQ